MSITFPVNHFFPKEKYEPACKQNRGLTPTYLIAHDQGLDVIKKEIGANEAAGRSWKGHQTQFQVTPLIVAVWRQNPTITEYLLSEKQCDPYAVDALGFLPINYAEAIGREDMITLLKAAMKADYVSHKAVWARLLKCPTPAPETNVFSYVNERNEITPGNAAQFRALTGADFVPTIFFPSNKALIEELAEALNSSTSPALMLPYDLRIIQALEANEVPLYLQKQEGAGWGVNAAKELEPFVPVVIYAGEWSNTIFKVFSSKADYRTATAINAYKWRNLGGMVNEGFPNCALQTMLTPEGVRYSVILPIRPIAKGESLYIDYGYNHSFKRMKRSELNMEEARKFLETKTMLQICQDEYLPLLNACQRPEGMMEPRVKNRFYALAAQLNYIFHTSSMYLPLALEKKISAGDLKILTSERRYSSLFRSALQKQTMESIADGLELLHQAAAHLKWDLFMEINQHLERLSQSYSATTVLVAFEFILMMIRQGSKASAPLPKPMLKIIFGMFDLIIPAFEITLLCFREERDVTRSELSTLEQAKRAHPQAISLYLDTQAHLDTTPYPKLKKFIESLHLTSQSQPDTSQQNLNSLLAAVSMMMPHTQ